MSRGNLIIYHTNDLHGKLDIRSAERIVSITANRPGLLLDAGDAVSAGNLGVRLGGERILRLMTELGYTAMAMGNREFHPLPGLMKRKLSAAGFPVLCANLRERRGEGSCRSSLIAEHHGYRLGLIGVCRDMLTGTPGVRLSPFKFIPPVDAVMREMERLEGQVDSFILLSHLGLREDVAIAQQVAGLDLIIGGHSHDAPAEGIRSGETLIVQAGCRAAYLGVVCFDGRRWTSRLENIVRGKYY